MDQNRIGTPGRESVSVIGDWHKTHDGRLLWSRLLWGGRVGVAEPSPKRVAEPSPKRIAAALLRDAVRFDPGLQGIQVETAWGGATPFSRQACPASASSSLALGA